MNEIKNSLYNSINRELRINDLEKRAVQCTQAVKDSIQLEADHSTTFEDITDLMIATYHKKNKDYGNAFDKSLDEFGMTAAAIRLNDKLNRFKTLIKSDSIEVKDESIDDTLLDLANYAILTYLYRKNNG